MIVFPPRRKRLSALCAVAVTMLLATGDLEVRAATQATQASDKAPAPAQAPTSQTTQATPEKPSAVTQKTEPIQSPTTTSTTPAAQTTSTSTTPRLTRNTAYSQEAVLLVVLILTLLGLLFWLLLRWSHRLDQASYLGSVYRESVKDFEYKRLATVPIEKLQKEDYQREIIQDTDWREKNPEPTPPPGVYDPGAGRWTRPPGSGTGGLGGPPPPPRSGGDPTQDSPQSEAERRSRELWEKYQRERAAWTQAVNVEAYERYKIDLAKASTEATERAGLATDVDLSVLRGRGAEFVLEFTTVVVIIFAAVVLGVLDILGTEQIGTLLAAIAGYVLGRATTRGRSTADGKAAVQASAPSASKEPGKQSGRLIDASDS